MEWFIILLIILYPLTISMQCLYDQHLFWIELGDVCEHITAHTWWRFVNLGDGVCLSCGHELNHSLLIINDLHTTCSPVIACYFAQSLMFLYGSKFDPPKTWNKESRQLEGNLLHDLIDITYWYTILHCTHHNKMPFPVIPCARRFA